MKKIICVLFAALMVISLCACDAKNNETAGNESVSSIAQISSEASKPSKPAESSKPEETVCIHSWTAATCTTPKTCSKCKETEGKATGHKFTAATCTAPKTCSVCKTTEGKASGHRYDKSGTCDVCFSRLSISKVILDQSSLKMKKGESATLNVTYEPKYDFSSTITWTSSDESVATVSWTGKVTAVGPGTAIISATEESGKTARCTVTVTKSPLSVDASIGITMMASNTFVGQGISVSIEATGGSENYVAYNIKLYRNDEFIDETNESEMFVTPALRGTYKAEVYVKDSEGTEARTTTTTTIG